MKRRAPTTVECGSCLPVSRESDPVDPVDQGVSSMSSSASLTTSY